MDHLTDAEVLHTCRECAPEGYSVHLTEEPLTYRVSNRFDKGFADTFSVLRYDLARMRDMAEVRAHVSRRLVALVRLG